MGPPSFRSSRRSLRRRAVLFVGSAPIGVGGLAVNQEAVANQAEPLNKGGGKPGGWRPLGPSQGWRWW